MKPHETFKLIQCYHCLTLAHHLKNQCPFKDEPQICGRCGKSGHASRECSAAPYCHLCNAAGHPATARICPKYREKFEEQLDALFRQPPPASQGNSYQAPYDKSWDALQSAARASTSSVDFWECLYKIIKASDDPSGSVSPFHQMAFGCDYDLDVSQESFSEVLEHPAKDTSIPVVAVTPVEETSKTESHAKETSSSVLPAAPVPETPKTDTPDLAAAPLNVNPDTCWYSICKNSIEVARKEEDKKLFLLSGPKEDDDLVPVYVRFVSRKDPSANGITFLKVNGEPIKQIVFNNIEKI